MGKPIAGEIDVRRGGEILFGVWNAGALVLFVLRTYILLFLASVSNSIKANLLN